MKSARDIIRDLMNSSDPRVPQAASPDVIEVEAPVAAMSKVFTITPDELCQSLLRIRQAIEQGLLEEPPPATAPAVIVSSEDARRLATLHQQFQKHLGRAFESDALDVLNAARIAHLKLTQDLAPWLLLVGGSGDAKTELLKAFEGNDGAGGIVAGTITSQASLLTGLGKKDQDKDATGGLLKQWPKSSFILMPDVTTTISLSPNARAGVLDAFRWIHDGSWPRSTGGGGGMTSYWEGRIGVVGAVTDAIDLVNDVIVALGARWLQIRLKQTDERRKDAARKAVNNSRFEDKNNIVTELRAAERAFLGDLPGDRITPITDDEAEYLVELSDFTTRMRSAVVFAPNGWNIIHTHMPEMPTRFSKHLVQMFRGLLYAGHTRDDAMRLSARLACDCISPLRVTVLEYVIAHPGLKIPAIAEGLKRSDFQVKRELETLYELGMLQANGMSTGVYNAKQYTAALGVRIPW
ncbi:MAG TPA: hypothetical protein VI485_23095 [Vicinamibacterales bacterium]|nr:hypothetical protein [Vicinamibacterales bacterium]